MSVTINSGTTDYQGVGLFSGAYLPGSNIPGLT